MGRRRDGHRLGQSRDSHHPTAQRSDTAATDPAATDTAATDTAATDTAATDTAATDTAATRPDTATGTARLDAPTMMAGVIVWLAQRQLPAGRRRRYHLAVARFLHRRGGQRPGRTHRRRPGSTHTALAHTDFTLRYLVIPRGAGHGHDELVMVAGAVGWLRRYLSRPNAPTGAIHDPVPR